VGEAGEDGRLVDVILPSQKADSEFDAAMWRYISVMGEQNAFSRMAERCHQLWKILEG
jgi:hypothetical protein